LNNKLSRDTGSVPDPKGTPTGYRPIESLTTDGCIFVDPCIWRLLISSPQSTISIRTGTIFWLGEQKLVKNNHDNQIQNTTLCNMYFFETGICDVQWVWRQSPRSWGILKIACDESNLTLQPARLLLTVSYRKNWGNRMYHLLPQ